MIKKHLLLTCIAYAAAGFGVAVEKFGIKGGLGLYPSLIIFISCMIFYIIVIFTSTEKVKAALEKELLCPGPPSPDNEACWRTIDALYQAILAKKIPFPGEIREVFHEAMNKLTDSRIFEKEGKFFQEIQVPWAEATEEERSRWASYNQHHVKRMVEIKKEDLL